MEIWRFIQDQILGMKWLNELIGAGLSTSGLDAGGRIGGSVRFFSLRCIENHSSALFSDFYHFLNTELLSAGTQQPDPGPVSWNLGQYHVCAAGDTDTVLLLFVYSALYRLYGCRTAVRRNVFFSDFFADGGFRESSSADEHFRREGCDCLCDCRPDY